MNNTEKDRAIGCFIGLAIGDALGCSVEFKEVGEFDPVTEMRYSGVWRIPAGYWTDDTSMALCLADSIIANDSINPTDLLERFARWYQHGENSSTGRCFDIGGTTRKAITEFLKTKTYQPAENRFDLNGNGSIMRLAPVAVRWFREPTVMKQAARLQSMTTHGADACLDSCEELAMVFGSAISGKGDKVMEKLREFAKDLNPPYVPNSGYVLDTMAAAYWAVGSTDNFNDAVLKAVNLGGDADTIGAVTGMIAGSLYGYSSIKQSWLNDLYKRDYLLDIAEKLYKMSV